MAIDRCGYITMVIDRCGYITMVISSYGYITMDVPQEKDVAAPLLEQTQGSVHPANSSKSLQTAACLSNLVHGYTHGYIHGYTHGYNDGYMIRKDLFFTSILYIKHIGHTCIGITLSLYQHISLPHLEY